MGGRDGETYFTSIGIERILGTGNAASESAGTAGQVLLSGGSSGSLTWGSLSAAAGRTSTAAIQAGFIGEILTGVRLRSSPITLATNSAANLVSAALQITAGTWDVQGVGGLQLGATSSLSNFTLAISKTSATLPSVLVTPGADGTVRMTYSTAAQVPGNNDVSFLTPVTRVMVSATTNFYLVGRATFTGTAPAGYGYISARRIA